MPNPGHDIKYSIRDILRFYFITDEASAISVIDQVKIVLEAGATIIQYRNKSNDVSKYHEALEIRQMCKKWGVPFIVNDDVILAKAVGADGVHVGQGDVHPQIARSVLGDDAIIGISVSSLEELEKTDLANCDYIGVGPVFETSTKKDANPVTGVELLSEICMKADLPIVAIGGITVQNASLCLGAGACGICMISAITRAADSLRAASEFASLLKTSPSLPDFFHDESELLSDVLTNTTGHKDFNKKLLVKPGDDACLLSSISRPVISTDSQIEGVHFKLSWQSPFEVGRKAVSICLSDLAASYAKPVALFLNLGLPDYFSKQMVRDLYKGIQNSLESYGCGLGGGNISKSSVLSLDLFAIGEGSDIFPVRSAAKPGFGVYSTGFTGFSRCGLILNMSRDRKMTSLFSGKISDSAFRNPRARFDAAAILEKHGVECVMDISDGIAADALRMAEASGVTIEILPDDIKIHPEILDFCSKNSLDPLKEVLQGGEDYELLFSCDDETFAKIAMELPSAVRIGVCKDFSGRRLENIKPDVKAFDHLKLPLINKNCIYSPETD